MSNESDVPMSLNVVMPSFKEVSNKHVVWKHKHQTVLLRERVENKMSLQFDLNPGERSNFT